MSVNLSRSSLTELNNKLQSESVGAAPKPSNPQEKPPTIDNPDGVDKMPALNLQRLHDLLTNPIFHPLPNPGPIPRS